MIGVETLPQKKKGEYWVFDESACRAAAKLLPTTVDI